MWITPGRLIAVLTAYCLMFAPVGAIADEESAPFITEAYYRIEWGHFDEFMELFKKNHYPILARLKEQGHIESISAAFPVNHASEESRWDFRLTIVIPDTGAFAQAMPGISKELYPDQEKLDRDERRRFSLLKAHTDIVIRREDVTKW
ncbi:MAG: hypothetical protein CL908_16090 [Deltaproteobacteria bacterium]|nr:hypothetical protein [Deltaproteobacteria bacterium]